MCRRLRVSMRRCWKARGGFRGGRARAAWESRGSPAGRPAGMCGRLRRTRCCSGRKGPSDDGPRGCRVVGGRRQSNRFVRPGASCVSVAHRGEGDSRRRSSCGCAAQAPRGARRRPAALMLRIDPEALGRLPADQRDHVGSLLAEYETALRTNPLLSYEPHSKQITFHESREPLKAFLGGNRSGKTTAGILDDLIQAVDRDCLPEHLAGFKHWEPPFYCRIIVPDFTSTLEGVIFEKLREWAPRAQLAGGEFGKAYDKTRRKLCFKNGSWMDFLTFEQDLDKFGGAALHRGHYDEEAPLAIRRGAG